MEQKLFKDYGNEGKLEQSLQKDNEIVMPLANETFTETELLDL